MIATSKIATIPTTNPVFFFWGVVVQVVRTVLLAAHMGMDKVLERALVAVVQHIVVMQHIVVVQRIAVVQLVAVVQHIAVVQLVAVVQHNTSLLVRLLPIRAAIRTKCKISLDRCFQLHICYST
jgi:hypothetical protein